MTDTNQPKPGTCGEYGGTKPDGEPCGRPAGWGVKGAKTGECRDHLLDDPVEGAIFSELSEMERLFAKAYVGSSWFNASEAAKQAGYSPASAYSQGSRLLKRRKIREAIDRYLELNSASENEILHRMTARARGSLGPFLTIHHGRAFVDLSRDEVREHLYLVRKVKQKTLEVRKEDQKSGEVEEVILTEVELYDAHQADRDLAKARGIFSDTEVDVHLHLRQLSDDDLIARIEEKKQKLERLRAHGAGGEEESER